MEQELTTRILVVTDHPQPGAALLEAMRQPRGHGTGQVPGSGPEPGTGGAAPVASGTP